jgi:hypothetical protein
LIYDVIPKTPYELQPKDGFIKKPKHVANMFSVSFDYVLYDKVTGNLYMKGKTIPLQPWTGPEVSRRLRLPDFKKISTQKW